MHFIHGFLIFFTILLFTLFLRYFPFILLDELLFRRCQFRSINLSCSLYLSAVSFVLFVVYFFLSLLFNYCFPLLFYLLIFRLLFPFFHSQLNALERLLTILPTFINKYKMLKNRLYVSTVYLSSKLFNQFTNRIM